MPPKSHAVLEEQSEMKRTIMLLKFDRCGYRSVIKLNIQSSILFNICLFMLFDSIK